MVILPFFDANSSGVSLRHQTRDQKHVRVFFHCLQAVSYVTIGIIPALQPSSHSNATCLCRIEINFLLSFYHPCASIRFVTELTPAVQELYGNIPGIFVPDVDLSLTTRRESCTGFCRVPCVPDVVLCRHLCVFACGCVFCFSRLYVSSVLCFFFAPFADGILCVSSSCVPFFA